MRLMCPNCDAEYEVDASAIPESGRDVQCSNCGHAWFQLHPEMEADQEAEAALYDPPPPLSKAAVSDPVLPSDLDWMVESDDPEAILDAMGREFGTTTAQTDAPAQPDAPASFAPEFVAPEPDVSVTPHSDRPDPVPKHDMDPESLQILREEVAFETAQRALEQNQSEPATPVVARRVARLKGIQPPAPTNPPAASRAKLPKIDSVSDALRPDALFPAKADPKPKSGRGGVVTVVFIALTATAAYVFSPNLATLLPDLAKPLMHYVAVVDGARDQLDIFLPRARDLVQTLAAEAIAIGAQAFALVKGWF